MTYTEMVSARGLIEPGSKLWPMLETSPAEGPVVAHLYGTEPDTFAEAAVQIEATRRFVAIDVNAGCPAPKVVATGAGSELMKDPQRLHDIIVAVKQAVRLPVSLKTRLGVSPDKVLIYEVLAAAEAAGAAALALHGRYASQGHRGLLHMDMIGQVKQRAKIPIIGNGNVHTPYAAWEMFEKTGVDAIMIARAAIGNPWLFQSIRASFASKVKPPDRPRSHVRPQMGLDRVSATLEAHLTLELEHRTMLHEKYGLPETAEAIEGAVVNVFRYHLFRYLHDLNGSSHVRRALPELTTLAAIRAAVSACLGREAASRAAEAAGEK